MCALSHSLPIPLEQCHKLCSSSILQGTKGRKRKRPQESELLLIYLKYWPDLHYWNISIRCWGKRCQSQHLLGREGNRDVKWGPNQSLFHWDNGAGERQEVANDRKESARQGQGGQGGTEQLTRSLRELSVRCSASLRCGLIVFNGLEMVTAGVCTFLLVQMIIVFVKGKEVSSKWCFCHVAVDGEYGFC